jgi:hypothetical protein
MEQALSRFALLLRNSPLHDAAVYLLSNVPGFPPIVQTVHLLSIACIAGSIVMIDLKVLGLALPSQNLSELVRRSMPWLWWSLPMLLISGSMFVLARPQRYFVNPVFGIKFALLLPAVLLALVFHLRARRTGYWEESPARRVQAKTIAAVSLLLWIGVLLAGRWIAFADYLFPGG